MPMPAWIAIGIAMLIPPPYPPPPPDRLAAAAELRRLAPLTQKTRDLFVEKAVYRTTRKALDEKGRLSAPHEQIVYALPLMTASVNGDRARIDERADACLDEQLGYAYDVDTLRDMASVVVTKGGHALWMGTIQELAQTCYDQAVSDALITFTPWIRWLGRHNMLDRVPRYDNARGDTAYIRDLETLCGRSARNRIQSRSGRLGVMRDWVDRELRRDDGGASMCLSSAVRATGRELLTFDQ